MKPFWHYSSTTLRLSFLAKITSILFLIISIQNCLYWNILVSSLMYSVCSASQWPSLLYILIYVKPPGLLTTPTIQNPSFGINATPSSFMPWLVQQYTAYEAANDKPRSMCLWFSKFQEVHMKRDVVTKWFTEQICKLSWIETALLYFNHIDYMGHILNGMPVYCRNTHLHPSIGKFSFANPSSACFARWKENGELRANPTEKCGQQTQKTDSNSVSSELWDRNHHHATKVPY